MNSKDLIYISNGILTTIEYTLVALLFGFIIAFPIAVMRGSKVKVTRFTAQFYISIIRGTPVFLQLSIWYFAFPSLIGLKISAFTAGAITFSINSSAYMAEIIRSGITAFDKGQEEAAKVLGIKRKNLLFDIILPQALKNISPAIINEMISLIKETAIIGVIGVTDIMRRAQLVSAEKYDVFTPLVIAAACYYFLSVVITFCYNLISKTR